MTQCSWSTFAADSKNHHLVVAQVPAGVADDAVALVGRLIEGVAPLGEFAVTSQKETGSTTVFCAFALATDAETMIEAIDAREDNLHLGWASEHHCVIDRMAAEALAPAVRLDSDRPVGPPSAAL